ALFVDLNADGLLDLYVWNYVMGVPPPDERTLNRLYLNLGDGSFADVSAASGADNAGATQAAAAFDPDGGGVTLYVANDRFCADGVPSLSDDVPGDAWYVILGIDAE